MKSFVVLKAKINTFTTDVDYDPKKEERTNKNIKVNMNKIKQNVLIKVLLA